MISSSSIVVFNCLFKEFYVFHFLHWCVGVSAKNGITVRCITPVRLRKVIPFLHQ